MCEGQVFGLEQVDVSEEFGLRVIRIEDGLLKEFRSALERGGDSGKTIEVQFSCQVEL